METITKSKERVRKYGEVYTPEWVVSKMCDMLETESADAFSDPAKTFLEPSCGNGNFLVEIFLRKLKSCESPHDGIAALDTIYGVDILVDNVDESRARLRKMYEDRFGCVPESVDKILEKNIVCGNFLTKRTAGGAPIWFLEGGGIEK